MDQIEVKIHDVMHDTRDEDINMNELADRIEKYVVHDEVQDVRIAPGPQNSPIFIRLEGNSLSAARIKQIAKAVVRDFGRHVDGVDVEKTVRDDNIRISAVDE